MKLFVIGLFCLAAMLVVGVAMVCAYQALMNPEHDFVVKGLSVAGLFAGVGVWGILLDIFVVYI